MPHTARIQPFPDASARRTMIESQLMPQGVNDERVLSAFAAIPREIFVPEALRGSACADEDLTLPHGRFLMEPSVFARLVMMADIKPHHRVLDVGCATGYSTAVLAHLAAQVVGLEGAAPLAEQAHRIFATLRLTNAEAVTGPHAEGYPAAAPYDVIVINGAVEREPATLAGQLAEGGRLVCLRRVPASAALSGPGTSGLARGAVYRKIAGKTDVSEAFDAGTPLLMGFALHEAFDFPMMLRG